MSDMYDTYRATYTPADGTEVEKERVRQAAETERKLLSEREETKRKRIAELGVAGHLIIGLVVTGLFLLIAFCFEKYLSSRGACQETTYVKPPVQTGPVSCTHPLHVPVSTDTGWTCRCGVARLP